MLSLQCEGKVAFGEFVQVRIRGGNAIALVMEGGLVVLIGWVGPVSL